MMTGAVPQEARHSTNSTEYLPSSLIAEAVRIGFAGGAFLGKVVAELVSAAERAGERPAHLDLDFPGGMLPEHRVEGDQLEDIDRLEGEFCRDPFDSLGRDVAERLLPEMQERQRRAPLGNGIVGDQFVGLRLEAFWQCDRRVARMRRAGINLLRRNVLRRGIDNGTESLGGHDFVSGTNSVRKTTPLTKTTSCLRRGAG